MNTSTYILFLIILCLWVSQQNTVCQKKIIKKRKSEETREMVEFAKRFIDKDCIVRTFNGNYFAGTIKEVSQNAVLIENNKNIEVINLEYVVSIKEHPRDKKGKKKSIYW